MTTFSKTSFSKASFSKASFSRASSAPKEIEPATAIHRFWFGTLGPDGVYEPALRQRWFASDAAFDDSIRQRFGPLLTTLTEAPEPAWLADAHSTLGYVLLCDQFPRNLFRGSAEAFAFDERARTATRHALQHAQDRLLGIDERAFLYLPLMHSESPLDQYLSIGLFATLRDESPPTLRQHAGNYLRHAQQHRDTILRFGRFPYRNSALGRSNTAAESAYLDQLDQGT